jgi:hypothetical protein
MAFAPVCRIHAKSSLEKDPLAVAAKETGRVGKNVSPKRLEYRDEFHAV